jgi:YidC/Oxa1 family membrane protein insertase
LNPWELIIQQPVLNVLIVMSHYLGDNFGVAIIALTIIVNACLLPLTLSQLRSAKAMQDLQPRLVEIQKKYAKDKQKLAQEQMRLYRESGVKPAGCAVTMIIQIPVWYALYQSIMLALAVAPEALLNLSRFLYHWPVVYSALPLSRDFIGLDLAQPNLILAILVGATMWLQQKMSTTMTPADPRQRQQTQMMLWMMPLLFAFFALSFPSGLSLYWVVSSIARIVMQYRVTGWGGLISGGDKKVDKEKKYLKFVAPEKEPSSADAGENIVAKNGEPKKKDQVVIYPEKPSKMRYQPGKGRERHQKK